jgi:hypothetical protein
MGNGMTKVLISLRALKAPMTTAIVGYDEHTSLATMKEDTYCSPVCELCNYLDPCQHLCTFSVEDH